MFSTGDDAIAGVQMGDIQQMALMIVELGADVAAAPDPFGVEGRVHGRHAQHQAAQQIDARLKDDEGEVHELV